MRIQAAHSRPTATAAAKVATERHGHVAAKITAKPNANMTSANTYTPTRVASLGSSSVAATVRRASSLTVDALGLSLLKLNFMVPSPFLSQGFQPLFHQSHYLPAGGTPSSRHC